MLFNRPPCTLHLLFSVYSVGILMVVAFQTKIWRYIVSAAGWSGILDLRQPIPCKLFLIPLRMIASEKSNVLTPHTSTPLLCQSSCFALQHEWECKNKGKGKILRFVKKTKEIRSTRESTVQRKQPHIQPETTWMGQDFVKFCLKKTQTDQLVNLII